MNSRSPVNPFSNCPLCPRLAEFREDNRAKYPTWHNAPVDTWTDINGPDSVELLVVGLAPGLKGANRTARPFTGDYAGDLLYATLLKFGFASGTYESKADDGLELINTAITNAVRCVPPQNKPVGSEINQCRPFLEATIQHFPNLKCLITLGKIAHDSTVRAFGERVSAYPFGHEKKHRIKQYDVISSYHCSRYNTNTGRLTPEMFENVFRMAKETAN